ncbi:DUF1631 family protein [Ramlibacter sp. AN1015]|uniref:DUF1631 family protein n=1 Tax=Ramlibacter sp. AN1015 TaxID=3133428 RepID=UPI0030C44FA0
MAAVHLLSFVRFPARAWRTAAAAPASAPAARTAANRERFASSRSANDSLISDAADFLRQRQALAEQIAIDLVQRPDLRSAPEAVQDFLLQVWAMVLAHAQLSSSSEKTCATLDATVDTLLWSIRRDATLRRPARLVAAIPQLLQQLRQGLALLGRAPEQDTAFFALLEDLHRPALELCATRRHVGAGLEVVDAGTALEGLRAGTWVELYCDHQWLRARLDWVDSNHRQFMFCSAHGHPHAMTRRTLEHMVRTGLLRVDTPAPPTHAAQSS